MLTHIDENDRPKMVDVSDKDVTTRIAVASGIIKMSREAFDAIKNNTGKKGPVLQTAVVGDNGREKNERTHPDVPPAAN